MDQIPGWLLLLLVLCAPRALARLIAWRLGGRRTARERGPRSTVAEMGEL